MPKNTFYRDNAIGAMQKVVDTRTAQKSQADGIVSVVDTIGSAHVQLRGASNFTPVDIASGIKVDVGDRVLMRRSTDTSRWVIYQNFGQGTSATSAASTTTSSSGAAALAPSGFAAHAIAGGLVFSWKPLAPDGGFVFEIDVADATDDTNSIIYQVAGSSWVLTTDVSHYARIRSVGLDWSRSGWTPWLHSPTPLASSGGYVGIQVNGTDEPLRTTLDFAAGAGVTITATDDGTNHRSIVTIAAAPESPDSYQVIQVGGSDKPSEPKLNLVAGPGITITSTDHPGSVTDLTVTNTNPSPLTTKGDIFVHSTVDDRLPVGTDGYALVADSGQSRGLKYQAWRALEPVTNGDDGSPEILFAYGDVITVEVTI